MKFKEIDNTIDLIQYKDQCVQDDVIYVKPGVYAMSSRKIESIIKISSIISRYDGKLALCEISDRIKENFKNSDIYDYCFRTKNELTSLGVFKI